MHARKVFLDSCGTNGVSTEIPLDPLRTLWNRAGNLSATTMATRPSDDRCQRPSHWMTTVRSSAWPCGSGEENRGGLRGRRGTSPFDQVHGLIPEYPRSVTGLPNLSMPCAPRLRESISGLTGRSALSTAWSSGPSDPVGVQSATAIQGRSRRFTAVETPGPNSALDRQVSRMRPLNTCNWSSAAPPRSGGTR